MLTELNFFRGNPPVLTHNDLRELNILDKEGSFLTVYVIDWEYSAWCPSYWEYYEAARPVHGYHWFEKLASEFLEPY